MTACLLAVLCALVALDIAYRVAVQRHRRIDRFQARFRRTHPTGQVYPPTYRQTHPTPKRVTRIKPPTENP